MIEVRVGGLGVNAGDLLHADENGVVSIPKEIVGELGDVCSEYCKAENIVIDYVNSCKDMKTKNGDRSLTELEFGSRLEGLIQARRTCAEELDILSKRVSKKTG